MNVSEGFCESGKMASLPLELHDITNSHSPISKEWIKHWNIQTGVCRYGAE